jgi:hypothetical protein
MKALTLFLFIVFTMPVCMSQSNFELNYIMGSYRSNDPPVIRANKIHAETVYRYRYDKSGSVDSSFLYTLHYDSLGNIVLKEISTNKGTTRDYYRYNEFNQLTEIDHGIRGTDEFDYDSAGNRIMDYWFTIDTSALFIRKREYNANNRPVTMYIKNNAADFYVAAKYKYDFEGNLIFEDIYNDRGENLVTYSYEIDREDRKTKRFRTDSHGQRLEVIYYFDSSGHCTRISDELGKNISNRINTYQFYHLSEYRYNSDGTFSEIFIPFKKKEYLVERHFYEK